jgi:hypothetical protein
MFLLQIFLEFLENNKRVELKTDSDVPVVGVRGGLSVAINHENPYCTAVLHITAFFFCGATTQLEPRPPHC